MISNPLRAWGDREDERELGKAEPEDQAELEDVVEGQPVGDAKRTLEDGEESEKDPVAVASHVSRRARSRM
jgi:hypothetical protein